MNMLVTQMRLIALLCMTLTLLLNQCRAHAIETDVLMIHAGSCRSAFLPSTANPTTKVALAGKVIIGNEASVKKWTWTAERNTRAGPNIPVKFMDPSSIRTTATFAVEGVYTLTLTGDAATSSLVVEVYDSTHNFGYNESVLQTFFTDDLNLEIDPSLAATFKRGSPVPAPNVHPRILFSPEDLPDLRTRLKETTVGRALFTKIRDRVVRQLTGGTDSLGRYYTKQNRTGKDGSGPDAEGPIYDSLAAGRTDMFAGAGAYQSNVVGLLPYLGFVLQIDKTSLPVEAQTEATEALASAAKWSYQNISEALPSGGCSRWLHVTCDYREVVQGRIFREFTGLAYDMLAPFMNADQIKSVRSALSIATGDMWSIGLDSIPSPSTDTSNWVPTHMMHLLFNSLAIEGEEGYHPDLAPRIQAGYERFIAYSGLLRDGVPYEGMGKDSIWGQMLVILGRRGSLLPALSGVVAHVQSFYLAASVPFGWVGTNSGTFSWDEEDGGIMQQSKYADVATVKWLYPTDPRIDFVFRTEMANLQRLSDFNLRFPYKGMEFFVRAVCALDWHDNATVTWEQAQLALKSTPANLSSFFNYRGLYVARSNWSASATQLFFQPRSVIGGHSQLDRTKFALAASNRWWFPYRPIDQPANVGSIVYADGQGPSVIPVSIKDVYSSGGIATFAVSDASLSYSRNLMNIDSPSVEPATFVANDFFWQPDTDVRHNKLPYFLWPDWQTASLVGNNISLLNETTELDRAYRTAGLIRGSGSGSCKSTNYALIFDDYKKANSKATEWTWRGILATDLGPANISTNGRDAILKDTQPMIVSSYNINRQPAASGARLLVRDLRSIEGLKWGVSTTYSSHDGHISSIYSLDANMTSITGNFATLLYPLDVSEALPTTLWSSDGRTITVITAGGCKDVIQIVRGSQPFETFSVTRSTF